MKLLLFLAVVALASTTIIPQIEKRSVVKRGVTTWGGFALLANTCPSGTSSCSTTSCCPTNWTCQTKVSTSNPICCPTSADCSTTVQALNACADQSWELFSFGGMFCCASDQIGTFSSAGQQCIANNLPVPSSISLTMVSQVTGTTAGTATGATSATVTGGQTTGTSPSGSGSTLGASSNSGTGSVQGTQTVSRAGSTASTTSDGTTSSSTSSKISSTAGIVIGVLAVVVILLVAFIIWRYTKRRNTAQQQAHDKPTPNPQISQQGGEIYATPAVYSPQPAVYKNLTPRTQELSGNSAQGPVYETGEGQHIELDASGHR